MEAATVRERGVRPVWFRLVRVREGLGRTDLSRGCEPLGQLADPGGLDRGLDGEPLYGRASLGRRPPHTRQCCEIIQRGKQAGFGTYLRARLLLSLGCLGKGGRS